ncbi:MAG: imidazolonepropionase [Oscillospiraceae bacterium]|nr:imidazolonepropionase [Oscillospiraceae bacterium]
MLDLVISNITLRTPEGKGPRCGKEQGNILALDNAAIGIQDGIIAYVGSTAKAPRAKETLDIGGRLVTPGLVDAHTHLGFGGWQSGEDGILSVVKRMRAMPETELVERTLQFAEEQFSLGVTTSEAKSGYGLSTKDELKQLRVLRKVNERGPVDIVSTFFGAQALPPEYKANRAEYIRMLCEEMLPRVKEEGLAEFCDITCDTDAFTTEETREILTAAKDLGFQLKANVDAVDCLGGAQVAALLGAVSVDYLIVSDKAAVNALARRGVVGVLLPTTSFYLNRPYAPARDMLHAGMAIAVGSDFNPVSSPSLNLPFAMTLATRKYGLTPEETLTAVTLNAAAALDRAESVGSLEVGKRADIVIWEADSLDYLCARFGSNLVHTVVKNGKLA